MTPPAVDCPCAACEALRAEAGTNSTWLRHKLLIRGWAGKASPAERAYIFAHASWARAAAANVAGGRFGADQTALAEAEAPDTRRPYDASPSAAQATLAGMSAGEHGEAAP